MAPAQSRENRGEWNGKDHVRDLSRSQVKKDFVYIIEKFITYVDGEPVNGFK